jgi:hypothetical protein
MRKWEKETKRRTSLELEEGSARRSVLAPLFSDGSDHRVVVRSPLGSLSAEGVLTASATELDENLWTAMETYRSCPVYQVMAATASRALIQYMIPSVYTRCYSQNLGMLRASLMPASLAVMVVLLWKYFFPSPPFLPFLPFLLFFPFLALLSR